MNRVALLIALGYLGLALVASGIYVSSVTKFVDYSETIFRFVSPNQVRVSYANFTQDPGTGNWAIKFRWRFQNDGRLPITLASFQFEFFVDNRSDARPYYEPSKLESEYHNASSIFRDRFTGPVIAPGSNLEKEWPFNATGAEAAKITRFMDGKVWVVLTGIRVVFYVANIDSRQVIDLASAYLGV